MIDPVTQAPDDEIRFIALVVGRIDFDRFAVGTLRPQVLTHAGVVVGDYGVRGIQYRCGGTIILFELDDRCAREVFLELMNMLYPRTTPSIDRLIVVADNKWYATISCENPEPCVLNRIGILKLINQQMLKAAPVVRQKLGVVAPQFVCTQQQLRKVDQSAALANFFIGFVERDHLPAVRITLIVEMLWPQALVFLSVNEILNFARHPAAVINLEVLEQPFDQAQLVVRVNDLEILRQAGLAPVTPQQPVREPVKRAYPQVVHGRPEQAFDTTAHFCGRLVGKGDSEQALWRNSLDIDEPGGTMHEHAGLAAAGTGNDEHGSCGRSYRLTLRVIE